MLVAAGCAGPGAPGAPGARPRPNFVVILVDDLGWRDLGCTGSSFYETPNVDRLAADGVRFTNGYAAAPVCSPTRASLLTGKYPARMDTTEWFGGRRSGALRTAEYVDRLPLEELTLAEALRDAGYATFLAGKWHLGGDGFDPELQGFDVNKGGHWRGSPPGGYFAPYDNPKLDDGPDGEHLPLRLADETCAFLADKQDEPFLAYLSFYSVHNPQQTTDALRAKYAARSAALGLTDAERFGREGANKVRLAQDHAVYGGMVEAMDAAVGRVLDALDELGLAENTVVVFTSDNGGLSTSEGHPTSNAPLRAGKGWVYEGGIREPWIVRAPGVTRPGTISDAVITSPDLAPTLLELAGLPPRPERFVDGRSFAPALRGDAFARGPVFWHYPHYSNQGGGPAGAVREGSLKLVEWYEDGRVELFDLERDPGETRDLAAERPNDAARLRSQLAAWRASVDAKMPTPLVE